VFDNDQHFSVEEGTVIRTTIRYPHLGHMRGGGVNSSTDRAMYVPQCRIYLVLEGGKDVGTTTVCRERLRQVKVAGKSRSRRFGMEKRGGGGRRSTEGKRGFILFIRT
jgi:hypothetical protein